MLSRKSKSCDNSKELPQQFSCTVISRTNKADEKGFRRRISRMLFLYIPKFILYETTSKQVFRLASHTPNKKTVSVLCHAFSVSQWPAFADWHKTFDTYGGCNRLRFTLNSLFTDTPQSDAPALCMNIQFYLSMLSISIRPIFFNTQNKQNFTKNKFYFVFSVGFGKRAAKRRPLYTKYCFLKQTRNIKSAGNRT